MEKNETLLEQFGKAVSNLERALAQPKNEFIRDSCIQRFEIAFDLGWKSLKAFLKERHGLECFSPKNCFREAFRQKLIEHDDSWLEIVNMRNETTHTYNESQSEAIYAKLPDVSTQFRKLLIKLKAG